MPPRSLERSCADGEKLKAVHYINQFFGQIGGEDAAGTGIRTEEKAVGPGLAFRLRWATGRRSSRRSSAATTRPQKTLEV
jgi:hypothetical protein